jgi:hypothetical protein
MGLTPEDKGNIFKAAVSGNLLKRAHVVTASGDKHSPFQM